MKRVLFFIVTSLLFVACAIHEKEPEWVEVSKSARGETTMLLDVNSIKPSKLGEQMREVNLRINLIKGLVGFASVDSSVVLNCENKSIMARESLYYSEQDGQGILLKKEQRESDGFFVGEVDDDDDEMKMFELACN